MDDVFWQDNKLQPPSAEVSQDDRDLSPGGLRLDQKETILLFNQDEKDNVTDSEDKDPPPQDQLQVQPVDQCPTEADGDLTGQSESPVQNEQNQDSVDRVYCLDQDQARRDQDQAGLDQDQAGLDRTSPPTNQNEDEESGGGVPALVVTKVEESRPAAAPRRAERPADLLIPGAAAGRTSLSSSSDGGDLCDLMSPRSDSFSLTSEPTVSRRSEEDDVRSIAASSVMSLFHRVQMDPLEKDWLRSSARGNVSAQRLLLAQEPNLVLKKDFITTALHWAAKQGHQEAVDMMLRSGADVNVRSGYTALHLASIHGHQNIIQTLISTHNVKTNIRDYHGKTAVQYWTGTTEIFSRPACQSEGRFCRGRRTQRFALPSLQLSRSRSHGQLHLDFGTVPQSTSCDALDLHV